MCQRISFARARFVALNPVNLERGDVEIAVRWMAE